MNIAQLSEQLKDVPQPKLIDYARNPNSVVPQFLALAEIQRRQRLQVPQTQPVRSTVADDVLQQANPVPQMMPQGVPTLPSGMGQQSFAGGGIVAFAEGGEADDDEDELLDKEEKGMMSLLAGLKQRFMNPLARLEGMPASGTARRAMAESAGEPTEKRGSHKYEDLVLSKAKAVNNDPNFLSLARHVLYKETGNLENPESAVSRAGARGIMQLMPATAKMLGVNPDIPEENALGGVTYLNQLYKKYDGNPVLTAAAYNAGPGRVDRILKSGQGLTALPRETRGYIAGLAGGGVVAFAGDEGSKVEEDNPYLERSRGLYEGVRRLGRELTDPSNYDLLDMYQRYIGQPFARSAERFVNEPVEEQAARFRRASMTPEKTPAVGYAPTSTTPPTAKTEPTKSSLPPMRAKSSQADVRKEDNRQAEEAEKRAVKKKEDEKPADTNVAASTAASMAPEEKDPFAAYLARQEEARQALKKGAEEDKYMAILQAGLGMLGGTSPYAMANIGAGALQGVKGYGESKRARAAEALALDKAELGALRARELSDIKKAQMEQLADYRRGKLSQSDADKIVEFEKLINNNRQIQDLIKRRQEANPLPGSPEDEYFTQSIEAVRRGLYKQYGMPYPDPIQLPPYPTKPEKPGLFEGLFGRSKPAQSTVPPPPKDFVIQK